MKIQCPFCNQHLDVPDEMEGQDIKCPSCNQEFIVIPGEAEKQQKPKMERCMICGTQIYKFDTKCPKCGSITNKQKKKEEDTQPWKNVKAKADYGLALLIIPICGCVGLYFLPLIHHNLITFAVIIGTAIVASMEANANKEVDVAKKKQSSVSFFICILLLWIVGYPYYLTYRVHYGLKNFGGIGILIALIFAGLVFMSQSALYEITKGL